MNEYIYSNSLDSIRQPETSALGQHLSQAATGEDLRALITTNTAGLHLPDLTMERNVCALAPGALSRSDGPGPTTDNSANGQNPHQQQAELGNAHSIVELIGRDGFQDKNGNLTAAGEAAIRAAIANASWYQSFANRANEVQNYINRHVAPPISLRYDADESNASTLMGSRPYIVVAISGNTTRIPMGR